MKMLADLGMLLLESVSLLFKGPGFWRWVPIATGAAVLTFTVNVLFCRLWNRRYTFTVAHLVGFGSASLLAFTAVLAWPASSNLENAVDARILAWENFLTNGKVACQPEWNRLWTSSGASPLNAEVDWSLGLAFKLRALMESIGVRQKPVGQTPLVTRDSGGRSDRFMFDEALSEFRRANPFLSSCLPVDNERAFRGFSSALSSSQDSRGFTLMSKVAENLGKSVSEVLIPEQTRPLASRTRVVGVGLLVIAIGLPMLLSGLISYSQIKTGFTDRRTRAPAKVRLPSRSARRLR